MEKKRAGKRRDGGGIENCTAAWGTKKSVMPALYEEVCNPAGGGRSSPFVWGGNHPKMLSTLENNIVQ